MMSLEILNSVPPYPLQYNKAATRKLYIRNFVKF